MMTPEQSLQYLAQMDPEFEDFCAELSSELAGADNELPEGLTDSVIAMLDTEQPENAEWIKKIHNNPTATFAIDPILAAGIVTSMLFILRSRIKIKGDKFSFEHKPMDNELIKSVFDSFTALLEKLGKSLI